MRRIVFLGDSITEGKPGVSYVDMIKESYDDLIVNYGKGGDTIRSLNKRLKKLHLDQTELLFLYVGVNEVYSNINFQNKMIKILLNQTPELNLDVFESRYNDVVEYLLPKCKELIVLTPALIGEDMNSSFNQLLYEYVEKIKGICLKKDIKCIDLYQLFFKELEGKDVCDYLPYKLMTTRNDTLIKDISRLNQLSKERGLHVTIDGVHMNSVGASLIASEVSKYIKK